MTLALEDNKSNTSCNGVNRIIESRLFTYLLALIICYTFLFWCEIVRIFSNGIFLILKSASAQKS